MHVLKPNFFPGESRKQYPRKPKMKLKIPLQEETKTYKKATIPYNASVVKNKE